MARGKGRWRGRKRPFGAVAVGFRGIGPAPEGRRGKGEPELAQPVAPENERGKKQNARPVPGVARFNLRSVRNCARICQEKSSQRRERVTTGGNRLRFSGIAARDAAAESRNVCERARRPGSAAAATRSCSSAVSRCISRDEGGVLDSGQVDPDVQQRPLDAGVEQEGRRARVRGGVRVALLGELRQRARAAARPRGRSASAPRSRAGWRPRCRLGPRRLLLVGLLRHAPRARRRRRRPRSPRARGSTNSGRASCAASAIGRIASCEAAYFSLESVSAATISASDAPIAPAIAAAVPPPGVGASEASAARNPSSVSFEKSVMGGSSRPRGRGRRRRPRG